MASVNKTANLGLSQWEAGEGFFREDLNADFAKIDEALGSMGVGFIKPELLLEVQLPAASNSSIQPIYLDQVDLTAYKAIIWTVEQVKTCVMRFDNENVYMKCGKGSVFLTFPLGMDLPAYFISLNNESVTVYGLEQTFSKLTRALIETEGGNRFDIPTRMKIWGIK